MDSLRNLRGHGLDEVLVLRNRKPHPVHTHSKAAIRDKRRVRRTFIGNTEISSVLLSIAHPNVFDDRVFYFETMVFSDIDELDCLQCRAETHRDILKMHRTCVLMVKKTIKELKNDKNGT